MATQLNGVIETGHEDMIHDSQFDFYGKRIATCSSDRVIRVFDVQNAAQPTISAELRGHEGPVWQVAWAHPRFGTILASAGYDKKVCVWKETQPSQWTMVYQYLGHEASVNSISFAPHELGLSLACASADGSISVLTWKGAADNDWHEYRSGSLLRAHLVSVTAVSWAPALAASQAVAGAAPTYQRVFVSSGCDNLVKVWRMNEQTGHWDGETLVDHQQQISHSDWVRDVAWAPNTGIPSNVIASCSSDQSVIIWTLDGHNCSAVRLPLEQPVWRVNWSLTGGILAVSSGDSTVSLWKKSADNNQWLRVETLAE